MEDAKMIQEAYAGQRLVLIENEFGEIGIDGGFLQDAGINITEMNSGCICCTLVGDFGKALEKVIAEYHPDRIVIEPSGVGKLSDVVAAVEKVTNDDVQLDCTVAILKNVPSAKCGRKDIIKLDQIIDLDFDVLGFMDPGITVNIIRDGERVRRERLTLPETIKDIIKCKNPRCITSAEEDSDHIFYLSDSEKHKYRCIYCEQEYTDKH